MSRLFTLATGRLVLLALGVYLVFAVLFFSVGPYPRLSAMTGDRGILDERPGYTAAEAHALLEQLGETGRADYRLFLMIDLLNAVLLGTTLTLILVYVIRELFGPRPALLIVCLLPLLLAIGDLGENLTLLMLLDAYPAESSSLASVASVMTLIKVAGMPAILLALVGLAAVGWKKLRRWRRGTIPCRTES
jgi:hypothetical protein